jgi:starch synthase (maltosyl-transferring)
MPKFPKGRQRVVIEAVRPEVEGGRFPAKGVIGERLRVEADVFTDGDEGVSGVLRYRKLAHSKWSEVPLEPLVNDRWRGEFDLAETGTYQYMLQAWVDPFKSWHEGLTKKIAAGQDLTTDRLIGAELVEESAKRASGKERRLLAQFAAALRSGDAGDENPVSEALAALMAKFPDRNRAVSYDKVLSIEVDRETAGFSTWYEIFPRSCSGHPGKHGTLRDCESRLPYVAAMGFDVLYLPPIHPVGRSFRKGKNNEVLGDPDDVGSPWAIGSGEGGHKAIHPLLGTLEDFQRLVAKAKDWGMKIALDIAFQCTPDHPYVKEHPEWFRKRPDGSIQYAENPPKKYQDIYPLDFETEHWKELWNELRSVFLFWCEQGVTVFRVDNPHTKPFPFWEWVIREVKMKYPDALFLAEAFTRPKVMYRLAKLGFSQSYTYFTWRNTKAELTEYFTELTQTEVADFFRPNLWPNTPDILTEYLQTGGRPAFMTRLVLAATLGANYGIYGPAFELCENVAREKGSEEYLNSEKYEIRDWNLQDPASLREFIARINRIRRENKALQSDRSLRFHQTGNEELICYSKKLDDQSNLILTVVNLDPHHRQSGWVELPLKELGLDPQQPFEAHDLLTDAHYPWHGPRNYVELNPHSVPAHVFRLRQTIRREQD